MTRLLRFCSLSIALAALSGCAVVAVADAAITVGSAAVSVATTTVKAGAAVVSTTVDVASAGVKAVAGSSDKKAEKGDDAAAGK